MRLQWLVPVFVALVLFCQMPVMPAAAQILAIGNVVGRVGDIVPVEFRLNPASAQVSALVGDIRFDPNAVSIQRCAINPAIGEKSLSTRSVGLGSTRFIIVGIGQSSIPAGVLLTCEFAVLPGALTTSASNKPPTQRSALILHAVSAADPQGRAVALRLKEGHIVIHRRSSHQGRD